MTILQLDIMIIVNIKKQINDMSQIIFQDDLRIKVKIKWIVFKHICTKQLSISGYVLKSH